MGISSKDWEGFLSSTQQSNKRFNQLLEDEEKRKKQANKFNTDFSKAGQAASQDNGFSLKAAAGLVGKTIKETAVDAYGKGKNAIKGNLDVLQGNASSRNQVASTKKLNEVEKVRRDYIDSLSDADYDRPEVQQKLADFEKKSQEAMSTFKDEDRRQIQESQNVDTKKVAADSAETYLNVATLGIGSIPKKMLTAGATRLTERSLESSFGKALKAYGPEVAERLIKNQAADQATKQAAKTLSKQGVKTVGGKIAGGAAEGAIYSGAAAGIDAEGRNLSDEDAVSNIASGAAFGGALGGVLGGVGGALGVRANNKKFKTQEALNEVNKSQESTGATTSGNAGDEKLQLGAGFKEDSFYDDEIGRIQRGEWTEADDVWKDRVVTTEDGQTIDVNSIEREVANNSAAIRDLQQQASGIDLNTGKSSIPDGVDPSTYTGDVEARAKAAQKAEELIAKNNELKAQLDTAATISGGTSRELDNAKVIEKFKSVREEAAQAKEYNYEIGRQEYMRTNGDTVKQAKDKLAAFDAGEYSDAVYMPGEKVTSLDSVLTHPKVPQEMKSTALELAEDSARNAETLDGLTTKELYDRQHQEMDAAYFKKQEEISQMPEPRQELEMAKLTEKYLDDIDELESRYEGDAELVAKHEAIKNHLDSKEAELVRDTNLLMDASPDSFRYVDDKLLAEERARLEENVAQAEIYDSAVRTIEQITESGEDIVRAAEIAPERVNNAVSSKLAADTIAEGFKNSGGIRRALLGWLSDNANFESMGLRKIHTGLLRAEQTVVDKTKTDMKLIKQVADAINRGDITNEQIVDFTQGKLESPIENPEAAELVQKLLGDKATIIRKRVYDDTIKDLTDKNTKLKNPKTEAEIINIATQRAKMSTIDGYFPHIDLDSTTSQFARPANNGDNASDISFGNLKHREKNSDQYSRDVVSVLSAYVTGFNKKFYLEPALEPLKDPKIRSQMHKAEEAYVDGYISKVLNRDTGSVEATVNGIFDAVNKKIGRQTSGNQYRKLLGAQRMLSAVAGLGGNVGSVLRNATQQTNSVLAIGTTNTAVGGKRFLDSVIELKRTGEVPPDLQAAIDSGVFDVSALASVGDELEMIINGSSGVKGLARKGGDILMSGIKYSDMFMRGQTFMGAMRMGEAKGLTGQALKDFAAEKVVDTQFITSRLDMPKHLNGPGMRSLAQFATFSVKQAEFLGRYGFKSVKMSKKEGGGYRLEDPSQFGRLVQASLVGAGFTAALAPIGFQASEWVPFGREVAEGEAYKSPLVRLLTGDKGKVGLNSVIWPEEVTDPETGEKRRMSYQEAAKNFFDDNWNNITPAGNQIKKFSEGLSTTLSGVSKNSEGKIRYLQDMSAGDVGMAALFGQYATDAGKRWIKEGFPTLSESEMRLGQTEEEAAESGVTLETLERDAQEAYYNFYEAKKRAPSRSSVKAAMKKAAKEGNENKYNRVRDSYNEKVNEEMKKLYGSPENMPEGIKREYLKLLIEQE